MAQKMTESLMKARQGLNSKPGLGIISVEGDIPSEKYIGAKKKAALALDINIEIKYLSIESTTSDVISAIKDMGNDDSIDGIIVQLPLPSHIKRDEVLSAIPLSKDADVLSPNARAAFAHEEFPVLPPIVTSVQYILEAHSVALLGKEALVLGHGLLVGSPLAQFMRHCGARVTVIDRPVKDLNEFTKDAQIIICGTGVPHLLKPENVREGVIIIDAGISIEDGKLKGDAHPDVAIHADLFTPTPGGVGPLVVSSLMKNVILLAKSHGK